MPVLPAWGCQHQVQVELEDALPLPVPLRLGLPVAGGLPPGQRRPLALAQAAGTAAVPGGAGPLPVTAPVARCCGSERQDGSPLLEGPGTTCSSSRADPVLVLPGVPVIRNQGPGYSLSRKCPTGI